MYLIQTKKYTFDEKIDQGNCKVVTFLSKKIVDYETELYKLTFNKKTFQDSLKV